MAVRIAKLSPPRATRIHPRAALFRRLDQAARGRAVWITGPPGSGKTALATSWTAKARRRVLWYQLDAGDADVATFFHYMTLAAGDLAAALPRFTPEALEAPHLFGRRWFRALAEAARGQALLVLDDYHEVKADSALHDALAHGIAELPEGMAAVILSRREPPAPYARLEASEDLDLIDGDDLTLSLAEARAIAREREAAPEVIKRVPDLHARSGGWAAGFVLLLAGGKGDLLAAPRRGRLPQKVVFDYFDHEVLADAAPCHRRALLVSALLPRVTAQEAVDLSGVPDADQALADLVRRGYFTSRIQTSPPTYRFHDLFRDFLAERAQEEIPAPELAAIRSRAARLLAAAARLDEAIELAFQAGDLMQARELFLAMAPGLVSAGRLLTVTGLLSRFPPEAVESDPDLLYWAGTAKLVHDPPGSHRALERSYELHRAAGNRGGAALAWAALVESITWGLGDAGPLDRWIAELDEVKAWLPELELEVRARVVASAVLGIMHRQPGHPELSGWEDQALALALSDIDPSLRIRLSGPLLMHWGWWAGDAARASVIAAALKPVAESPQADRMAALVWLGLESQMLANAGQVARARESAEKAMALGRECGLRRWDVLIGMSRTLAATSIDDIPAAEAAARELGEVIERAPLLHRCTYHQMSSFVALVTGQHRVAVEHARASLRHAAGAVFPEATCRLNLALGLSRASPAGDLAALREAVAYSRDNAFGWGHAAGAQALASEALRLGRRDEGLEALREGLAVARRIGLPTNCWLSRRELTELCAVALEEGIEPDQARAIIQAGGLEPGREALYLEAWPRPMRVAALGGLAVEVGGVPLETSSRAHRRAMELVRLLVAAGPRGARAEALCDALWPSSEGDTARGALDTLAWRLRKLLGEARAVVQREGHFLLDPAAVFVDAWAVEQLADMASGGREARLPREEVGRRVRALAAGELLPGDEEPSVVAARERLRGKVERLLGAGR